MEIDVDYRDGNVRIAGRKSELDLLGKVLIATAEDGQTREGLHLLKDDGVYDVVVERDESS